MSLFMVWLWALGFMTVVMIAAWFVQRARKNGGWADVFWNFGMGVAGAGAALTPVGADGPAPRQILVAAMAALWSLRAGSFMARRVMQKPEDGRYTEFRNVSGGVFQPVMYLFLQVQAWAAALLAVALAIAARRPDAGLTAPDIAGAILMIIAVGGETYADETLRRFKADPNNANAVFDRGLWAWSRHPNYIFESLAWLSYAVVAIDLSGHYPLGWAVFGAPVFMTLMLLKVTGIPPLERSLLDSKGEAYRAYQQRVSAFLPRPPRAG